MSTFRLLVLHKERGLSLPEIGEILGIPTWKVRELLEGRIKPVKIKRSLKNSVTTTNTDKSDGKIKRHKAPKKVLNKKLKRKSKKNKRKIIAHDEF